MDKEGFTAYLESKEFSRATQGLYLLKTEMFLKWVGKEDVQITKPDILDYLEYLKNRKKNRNTTRVNVLIAIRHYFAYLFENDYIVTNPAALLKIRGTQVKRIYHIYTNDDLEELYDHYYNIYIRGFEANKYWGNATEAYIRLKRERNYVALGILIYQGIMANELKNIKIDDINLQKATLKIASSKQAKERTLPLKAAQMGTLINYIQNIRPQLNTDEYLFDFEHLSFNDFTKHLTHQIRKIERNFLNFRQIRASVITHWLQTKDLRKTQYLAGHRSIQATENYQPNNLESLIEDIAKHHPLNL